MTIYKTAGFYIGILSMFFITALAYSLSLLPFLSLIGPLAIAILISVIYRNVFQYPENLRSGIHFSAKIILRIAIILYGIRLNIKLIVDEGFPLIFRAALVIIFTLFMTFLIGKMLGVDYKLLLLLASGTGICGAAAIGAVSSILDSDEEDTAIAIGMIAWLGTIFALVAPLIASITNMTPDLYGQWVGFSLHEIAQALLAGASFGDDSLTPAILSKLSRVLLLFPVTILIIVFLSFQNKESKKKASFPYFILGFIALSIIGTISLQNGWMSLSFQSQVAQAATFLLTVAMAALGMSVDLKKFGKNALKPILTLILTSVALSVFVWIIL
ncbi:YeiH family protein [Ureibacillus chungkukjangi]|uniref:Putative integral membrane protein (TIGR00698 family) n=1 Tax=Ureibacillus chungkukjangi TaxID=1202712 RepID=A0A318TRS0_9BACL|nr:putative sulfate exporter family transporter [Ureibacillus chungkukjangi]MCM3388719.1 putative sulfate exporter family transporter [Ureibacillus chungkukjangi]PYF06627.1 putative integral membrane protein (TIGR00698 family) [Ureibacillus chungkukjangi]